MGEAADMGNTGMSGYNTLWASEELTSQCGRPKYLESLQRPARQADTWDSGGGWNWERRTWPQPWVLGGALADQAQGHPRGQACSARLRTVRAYTRTYFSKYMRVVGMKTTCTKSITSSHTRQQRPPFNYPIAIRENVTLVPAHVIVNRLGKRPALGELAVGGGGDVETPNELNW